jgi:hypothetical protein
MNGLGPSLSSAMAMLGLVDDGSLIARVVPCSTCHQPTWAILRPNYRVRGRAPSLMGIACRNGQHTRRFQEIAEATKKGCPVSQALEAVPIELTATVVG